MEVTLARPVIDVSALQLWKVNSSTILLSRWPGEVSDQAAAGERLLSDAGHGAHAHNRRELRAVREGVVRDGRLVRGHAEVPCEAAHGASHVTRTVTGAGRGPFSIVTGKGYLAYHRQHHKDATHHRPHIRSRQR